MNDEQAENLLAIVCPAIKHARCSHMKPNHMQIVTWDYWTSDTGLCWCNQCGKCLNGQLEYERNFNG